MGQIAPASTGPVMRPDPKRLGAALAKMVFTSDWTPCVHVEMHNNNGAAGEYEGLTHMSVHLHHASRQAHNAFC
jgi:hypothetical protein